MDDTFKETLIEQFRAYLDDIQSGSAAALETEVSDDGFSMAAELASLKSEVKRQSRQAKEALDQFKSVFATLQSGYDLLSGEFEQHRTDQRDLRREVLRPLLLQLLELHDRLEAGLNAISVPRRSFLGRLCRDPAPLIESWREGQSITLRRLKQILAEYHVRPLEALDKPLDPHTMRVVEVESRSDAPQGVVTGELRKGFFWGEELLRLAEVKVNKRTEGPS